MALAEARAVWQRTANRCLFQEDAKRAPKLACCSSVTPSAKETDSANSTAGGGQEIPGTVFLPFDPEPPYSNLSPNTRWWLQLQPSYAHHRGLMDGNLTVMMREEGGDENSGDFVSSESDYVIVDQTSNMEGKEKNRDFFEALESTNGIYFDSEPSWTGDEVNNTSWWRTADPEELALLVAQRSLSRIENCDLPLPQSPYAKNVKELSLNKNPFYPYESFASSVVHRSLDQPHSSKAAAIRSRSSLQNHGLPSEIQFRKRHGEFSDGTSELLAALRHSQTRARESEEAAKRACAEKEHIVKLLLRQASHLFAYKQWLRLLQLEKKSSFLQSSDSKQQAPVVSSSSPPWKGVRRNRRGRRNVCSDVGKYAVVIALGLGLVGAGLMLGFGMAALFLPSSSW